MTDPLPVPDVRDRRLYLDGALVQTRYAVTAACMSGGHLVVLYDPDANPRRWGTFRNLASLARDGTEMWLAHTAETISGDHFTGIESCDPLWVLAWSGFACRVDPSTGSIVEQVFTR